MMSARDGQDEQQRQQRRRGRRYPLLLLTLCLLSLLTTASSATPFERRQSSPSIPTRSSSSAVSSSSSSSTATSTSAPLLTAAPSSSATTTAPVNNTISASSSAFSSSSSSTGNATVSAPNPTGSPAVNSTAPPMATMPANILSNFVPGRTTIDFLNPLLDDTGFMTTILPMPDGQPNLLYGEPINAIISGRSSPGVVDVEGFLRWATSVNLGVSCLGQTNGSSQLANLGDGKGNLTQGNDGTGDNGVLRWNYGDPYIGTCKESVIGGNHLRWWPQAKTGAYFLAVSVELSAKLGHMIALNGYNAGRDELVGNATNPNGTYWQGYRFNTTVEWIPAGVLLNATSDGINHPDVALPGQPSQDGRVALLTITQLATPSSKNAAIHTRSVSAVLALLPIMLIVAVTVTL
ncbi:hypothetical protein A4X06_0g5643 [Tilletia controversa]|uniref:Uncharacterized protein n=4 Tax=Tilletia TaxID=13289 RepID=A0A8X7SVH6_9BASI|nr:hypothetical protein CF328_g4595 [Tilletia controversa]KAE8245514.1 hypothetical protein A4X06_0g5643 [Tilletia controversa]